MEGGLRLRVQRSERKPLYVQVRTEPPLPGCWSVNMSESGIGLVARAASPEDGPKEGDELRLEWVLPGARTRLRAVGLVRWRHDAREPREGATTSLGIQFVRLGGSDRVQLSRYLLEHRVKAVVANATRAAERALRAALQDEVELLHVAADDEIDAALGRGDVSAFVVFGDRESAPLAVAERALALFDHGKGARERPVGAAPPLVLWAPVRAERVLPLFNSGRLWQSLPPDCPLEALREAVLGACRQHGIRTEQQRMALELERYQARDRSEGAAPAEPEPGASAPGFQSPPMQRVLSLVRVVAPQRVAVLLQGETGTGKEVLARAVHRLSARSDAAFVVQDCGALPETLLESELFGHVKGAFTGALADHPGLFVLADGGTMFLDEIENTTANLQAKLLRAIETGELRPVGGSAVRQVDVRVIAASNRTLAGEVRAGRFRADLFYRLNTFEIDVPPLRRRREDLLPLALHFLEQFARAMGKSVAGFSADAQSLLMALDWPGNVRELRNVVERAVLLAPDGGSVTAAELPDALVARGRSLAAGAGGALGSSHAERMEEAERQILRDALDAAGGVLRKAAQALQMDPVTLGRRARRLGLRRH